MKRNQVIGVIILLIIVGAGSFYAGKSMAQSATPSRTGFAAGAGGAAGFAGRTGGAARTGAAGGFTGGTIVSASNGSISIQEQSGSSTEIVLITPSTQILKTTTGSASDLTTGTQVTVTGTSNSDGSLTATSIQIRQAGMNFPAGGARGGSTQTTPAQ